MGYIRKGFGVANSPLVSFSFSKIISYCLVGFFSSLIIKFFSSVLLSTAIGGVGETGGGILVGFGIGLCIAGFGGSGWACGGLGGFWEIFLLGGVELMSALSKGGVVVFGVAEGIVALAGGACLGSFALCID